MKKFGCILILVLCSILYSNTAFTIELGDPAPSLKISKWLKGKPVDIVKDRKNGISVITFWSTGCRHCREAMALLNEIQVTYQDSDVLVIGITDDEVEDVMEFITKQKDEIVYTIALDDNGGSDKLYMEGFGIEGVPHAFIINRDGKIAWEGNPLDDIGQVLEDVLDGRYDLQGRRMTARAKRLAYAYLYMSANIKEDDILKIIGNRIFQYGRNDADFLHWFAVMIIKAENPPDLTLAYRVIKKSHELSGGKERSILKTYAEILKKMGKNKEAAMFREKFLESKKPDTLNMNRP